MASFDFKDIGAQASVGDILSPRSSASSNPIQSLNFAPVWSLVMGSPSTSISPKSDAAQSPSIEAPITDYRPTSQGMAKGDGSSASAGTGTPAQLVGQQGPSTKQAAPSMLAGLFSSPLLLVGLAAGGYFLWKRMG